MTRPTPRIDSLFTLRPVGMDAWDSRVRPHNGDIVRVIQPHGCPRNGTMGHCYVETVRHGEFVGLVLINSLVPIRDPRVSVRAAQTWLRRADRARRAGDIQRVDATRGMALRMIVGHS